MLLNTCAAHRGEPTCVCNGTAGAGGGTPRRAGVYKHRRGVSRGQQGGRSASCQPFVFHHAGPCLACRVGRGGWMGGVVRLLQHPADGQTATGRLTDAGLTDARQRPGAAFQALAPSGGWGANGGREGAGRGQGGQAGSGLSISGVRDLLSA